MSPRALIAEIQIVVARHFRVKVRELRAPARPSALVRVRWVGMWLVRDMTGASLHEIGQRFGGRDHSSVVYGLRELRKILSDNLALCDTITALRTQIAMKFPAELGVHGAMAVRDLFAAVARPPAAAPPRPEAPTTFQQRWAELGAVVAAKWGQPKLYWLEMKTAWMHKLIEASGKASNEAFAAALDDLRDTKDCPHNISTWMASAIMRAMDAEQHKAPEHTAMDAAVVGRRDRAFRRIARVTGHDGAP